MAYLSGRAATFAASGWYAGRDGAICALCLRALNPAELEEVTVKGGVIVAMGETDIYDPASELHRRFEIGVTSTGRFHSVDPGKLTMAPYFADVCASRILEDLWFMSGPLVTIGVPVYRGQDDLPITLECLRTQSYHNIDVLISVDAADQKSAEPASHFCAAMAFSDARPAVPSWMGRKYRLDHARTTR